MQFNFVLLSTLLTIATAFVNQRAPVQPRVKHLNENFFLDIPTVGNPEKITPKELFGEVAYKSFVRKTNPDGLLSRDYNILQRARETRLLSQLADSGLIQSLEAKGLTLSKIEKLLPLADELNVLPFVAKNKDLLLALAPLAIEPAGILLPIVSKLVSIPPSTFLLPGAALTAYGGYESFNGDAGGILLVLLGFPAVALGAVLNLLDFGNIPTAKSSPVSASPATSSSASSRPVVKQQAPKNLAPAKKVRKLVKIN